MVVIRDLYKSYNLVEPLTCDEHIAMWNYCYGNAKHLDGEIDYKLVELSMFDSCESFTSFDSDNTNNSDIFPSSFSGNTKLLMVANNPKYNSIGEFRTHDTC